MDPFSIVADLEEGAFAKSSRMVRKAKRLSSLREIFEDEAEYKKSLSREDRVVYEYTRPVIPPEPGQLFFGTSTIHPGRIGREYFMTAGHYHAKLATGEVYLCLKGEGILLMQNRAGQTRHFRMRRGVTVYVPPCFAHRTVNTGSEEFVCFYCFPGDAGHDYESLKTPGFLVRVQERKGKPSVVPSAKRREGRNRGRA
jgi:glucose-6-phosphate isomerase